MASKERRRRGHIEARPNGSYRAIVFAGTDSLTGKDRYLKRTAPTLREAEKLLTKLQNEVDERRHARSSVTVSAAIDQWLEVAKLEASTRARYDQVIRLYITPNFGKAQLADINAERLEKFYARLQRCRHLCEEPTARGHTCAPLAANTVRKVHFIFRATFDRAVRWNYVTVNAAELADPPTSSGANLTLRLQRKHALFLTKPLATRSGRSCSG